MQTRSSLVNWVIIILALSPVIYLILIWSSLPGIVPVHYNLNFKPDKMDTKDHLWLLIGIISGISLLVYFLLLNIHKFDPKQRRVSSSFVFTKLAIGIVVFLTIINFLILISIKQNSKITEKSLFPLLGLLVAFIGNYMNNLKPNYFAGIRLPWTLSSDYNWRKTHQLAGKLWFWGGLLAAILSLFLPSPSSKIIFFIILFIMIVIPIIYSYKIFKQETQNNNA